MLTTSTSRPSWRLFAWLFRAKVNGIFMSSDKVWGTPTNWRLESPLGYATQGHGLQGPLLTAGQKMAEKREDYGILNRGLAEFSLDVVSKPVKAARHRQLVPQREVHGPAVWLRQLHRARNAVPKASGTISSG